MIGKKKGTKNLIPIFERIKQKKNRRHSFKDSSNIKRKTPYINTFTMKKAVYYKEKS